MAYLGAIFETNVVMFVSVDAGSTSAGAGPTAEVCLQWVSGVSLGTCTSSGENYLLIANIASCLSQMN